MSSCVTSNPYITVINKRIRTYLKKLKGLAAYENKEVWSRRLAPCRSDGP